MMIEVRRDLYMNEKTGEQAAGFAAFAARLCRLIEALATGRWADDARRLRA